MIELFLSDVTQQVRLEQTEGGKQIVRGLPVLQVGVWNGREYTADDLRAIATNFSAIQADDAWEPPLRPYHGYDSEGKPLKQDAREVLGWHKGMAFDESTGRLLADVELVDEETARDMLRGKLRYISGEVMRSGYKSAATGKTYDTPAYIGGAFVDNPAVKGMPWQIVTNAAEYGQPRADKKEGDAPVGLIETLKKVLSREGATPEELAELDQLQAAPVTSDATPAPAPAEDAGLKAQLEQLQKSTVEQAKRIEQMAAETRRVKAEATVDGWVSGGYLPPAKRVAAFALVDALSASGGEVEVLADDGQTTRKVGLVELLGELVTGDRKVSTEGRSRTFEGSPTDAPEQLSAEEIAAAADALLQAGQ